MIKMERVIVPFCCFKVYVCRFTISKYINDLPLHSLILILIEDFISNEKKI